MKNYYLQYSAYPLGDRLLEDVYFVLTIEETSKGLKITEVKPRKDAEAYLRNIRWKPFAEQVQARVEKTIEFLENYYEANGSTLLAAMAEFEAETGEPGIQILEEN